MYRFAHNGIEHASASETAAHSSTSVIVITLLVTLAAALVAGGAAYLVNRFAFKKAPIKDKEEN